MATDSRGIIISKSRMNTSTDDSPLIPKHMYGFKVLYVSSSLNTALPRQVCAVLHKCTAKRLPLKPFTCSLKMADLLTEPKKLDNSNLRSITIP